MYQNQRNLYFKDIIVNYEDKSKHECFDDMSTIEWSMSGDNIPKYVAETYDCKESLNYFQTNFPQNTTIVDHHHWLVLLSMILYVLSNTWLRKMLIYIY